MLAKSRRYFFDADAIREPVGESMLAKAEHGEYKATEYKHDEARITSQQSANRVLSDRYAMARISLQGANKRDVWTVATEGYKGAHFAVFPPDLVRPCILAATSAYGSCSQCGSPWIRDIVAAPNPSKEFNVGPRRGDECAKTGNANTVAGLHRNGSEVRRRAEDRGWKPSCGCDGDIQPCLVLDPFMGSGTTAHVSIECGREFVGYELNPEYHRLIANRLGMFYRESV